jgi:creatinine amidohydrolase
MSRLLINEMTWPELDAQMANIKLAIVPVGSCEQHGPNTTFATDAARAASYSKLLAERLGNKIVVFPVVNYGLSLHHMDFPGTVTLRVETMLHLLEDIAISISKHGIKKILYLNAHGGNFPALDGVIIKLKQEYGIDAYWSAIGSEISLGGLTGLPKLIGHACEVETSQALYLCPEIVREKRVPSQMQDSMLTRDSFVKGNGAWSWKNDASLNGALGDARKATAEIGKKMTDASLEYMEGIVEQIIARK